MSYVRVLGLFLFVQFCPLISGVQNQSSLPIYQNNALKNIIHTMDTVYKTMPNPKVSLDGICTYYQGLYDAAQERITCWAHEINGPVVPLEFISCIGSFLNHFAYPFNQRCAEPVIYISCMYFPGQSSTPAQQAIEIEVCAKKNSDLLCDISNRIIQYMDQSKMFERDAAYACGKQAIVEYHTLLGHEYGHVALGHIISQQWRGHNILWPSVRVSLMRNITGSVAFGFLMQTAMVLAQGKASVKEAGSCGVIALLGVMVAQISSRISRNYEFACDAFALQRSTPEQAEYFFKYLTYVEKINHGIPLSGLQKCLMGLEKLKGQTHPTAKNRIDAMRLQFANMQAITN